MPDRYPGYDVMRKRDTPSWNDATRAVVDARLGIADKPQFLTAEAWQTLQAVCARIVPQPATRPQVPIAALVDQKLAADSGDGYRQAGMPPLREAWQRGLKALDAEADAQHGQRFHQLPRAAQEQLLAAMQNGQLDHAAWHGMPCAGFFSARLAHDILAAYYAHPIAWSEIGFGGPASPRGYVRLPANRRDPWEAVEARPGEEEHARKGNKHVG
ncbi:MAG TPA: gluconate 2-dehydrogenase subunit 3 family protein [Oleiagrimonas sp.]|nr:gluconate 2-dehydrogenase subunit 3 family protein [Oleiagrimonas sp.]